MRRTQIAVYLKILGIVQLIGLNIGGFFWLAWAKGVRAAKPSSRAWVIAVHLIYVAFGVWGVVRWGSSPSSMGKLRFYGNETDSHPSLLVAFFCLVILIYGLPVVWLMGKNVKQEFIEQDIVPNP